MSTTTTPTATVTAPGSRAGQELATLLIYVLERCWLLAQRERGSTRRDLGAGVDAIAEAALGDAPEEEDEPVEMDAASV